MGREHRLDLPIALLRFVVSVVAEEKDLDRRRLPARRREKREEEDAPERDDQERMADTSCLDVGLDSRN